jgi:uncharacterized membrane protein YfcA
MNTLLIIAVFAVAVLFSMLGLGGGVLYVPILLAAGLDMHSAVPTSLAIMLVMSLTAAVVYHTNSLIDWKVLLLLEPASVAGAMSGGYFSAFLNTRMLYIIFACAMVLSAVMTLLPQKKLHIDAPKTKFPGFFHLHKKEENYTINLWLGIPASFLAGVVSSIIGIGGGFLKVPLMTAVFNVPVRIAVATSSSMIVITALTGFATHTALGHVDLKLAAILSVVVFFGALAGSKISIKTDKKHLNYIMITLQLIVAGWMVFKAVNY